MDLYTSLTQLKMAMNGGEMPPMTPLTEDAKRFIDPAFTIGMGALVEDEKKGLRCPIRGCGEWHHLLTLHLNRKHRASGGAIGVRKALSIPSTCRFVSSSARSRYAAAHRGISPPNVAALHKMSRIRDARKYRDDRMSMGARNLKNVCEAQVANRLLILSHKLGRSPTAPEAGSEYGSAFVSACVRLYGSWKAAKAQFGLRAFPPGPSPHTREMVVESLSGYVSVHGRLPTSMEVANPDRLPLVPNARTILKAMGTNSWPVAMSAVALMLGIDDPHYAPRATAAA